MRVKPCRKRKYTPYFILFLFFASVVFADPLPPPPPPPGTAQNPAAPTANAQVTISPSTADQQQIQTLFNQATYDYLANVENNFQQLSVSP